MKTILCILLFIGSLGLQAQKTNVGDVPSPKIICKVGIGDSLSIGDHAVKFIKVVSDSRCPKNVTCVWAGEAKVLIEIHKNGKQIEQKIVVVSRGPDKENGFFSTKNKSVAVYGLSPYPVDRTPIKAEKYILHLLVTKL